jgi:hypothetical protein
MRTIMASAAVALVISGSVGAAIAPGAGAQIRPGELTRGEVWVMNRETEPVPVVVRQIQADTPVRVRMVPPLWDYQTVVVKTGAEAARALAAAGAGGGETTGLSWPDSDGTIVLLKRPR